MRVFGSTLHRTDQPGSDVDLLAELPEGTGLLALIEMEEAAEQVLGVPVDLNTAANKMAAIDPQFQQRHPDIPGSPLHQMRSKLAHHDDDIQRAILWNTVTSELRQLKLRLEELL